ncbi:MAG: hypothetical protein K1X36_09890, partial [Pyrinomonadaceae bacterium]|nr:hypothetical protein [Pyrinomonadaceae bacterium]
VHLLGNRDHFRPFSGKFTRFVWDKKTSPYLINAIPSTLYSGSGQKFVPAVPACPTPCLGQITRVFPAFTAICTPIFATFSQKITLSYSKGAS